MNSRVSVLETVDTARLVHCFFKAFVVVLHVLLTDKVDLNVELKGVTLCLQLLSAIVQVLERVGVRGVFGQLRWMSVAHIARKMSLYHTFEIAKRVREQAALGLWALQIKFSSKSVRRNTLLLCHALARDLDSVHDCVGINDL